MGVNGGYSSCFLSQGKLIWPYAKPQTFIAVCFISRAAKQVSPSLHHTGSTRAKCSCKQKLLPLFVWVPLPAVKPSGCELRNKHTHTLCPLRAFIGGWTGDVCGLRRSRRERRYVQFRKVTLVYFLHEWNTLSAVYQIIIISTDFNRRNWKTGNGSVLINNSKLSSLLNHCPAVIWKCSYYWLSVRSAVMGLIHGCFHAILQSS